MCHPEFSHRGRGPARCASGPVPGPGPGLSSGGQGLGAGRAVARAGVPLRPGEQPHSCRRLWFPGGGRPVSCFHEAVKRCAQDRHVWCLGTVSGPALRPWSPAPADTFVCAAGRTRSVVWTGHRSGTGWLVKGSGVLGGLAGGGPERAGPVQEDTCPEWETRCYQGLWTEPGGLEAAGVGEDLSLESGVCGAWRAAQVPPFGNLYLIVLERPALFSFGARTAPAAGGVCSPDPGNPSADPYRRGRVSPGDQRGRGGGVICSWVSSPGEKGLFWGSQEGGPGGSGGSVGKTASQRALPSFLFSCSGWRRGCPLGRAVGAGKWAIDSLQGPFLFRLCSPASPPPP